MELQAIAGSVTASDVTFAAPYNEALVHQVVTAYLAGGRAGTRRQLNRAEVAGGGRKPWRQKGTGRARAGTIRSPLWRSGGVTFAARPQDWGQKVNRKMYRAAMRSILSELVRSERFTVVESLELAAPKTRELAGRLREYEMAAGLIVVERVDDHLYLAARNLPHHHVVAVNRLDPVALVGAERVLITEGAVRQLEEWLG
ncbi:MAG: 50S ribosomal protein L4 [Pseudomonadota bacterium]|jgi:large subunit ribosomal protein L4|nr:50S ribosomal protein L4 [Pseudomonadota bacterium]HJO35559.1 50S ribosomal protein L4 [Gammaproteobacteria bacterium]